MKLLAESAIDLRVSSNFMRPRDDKDVWLSRADDEGEAPRSGWVERVAFRVWASSMSEIMQTQLQNMTFIHCMSGALKPGSISQVLLNDVDTDFWPFHSLIFPPLTRTFLLSPRKFSALSSHSVTCN